MDVALTFDYSMANVVTNNSFSMIGGSVQVYRQFWRSLGLVADAGALHSGNMNNSGVGLDLFTVTGGPRYTWKPVHHGFSIYGQALGGGAYGLNSTFPSANYADSSARSVAVKVGTGMNVPLSERFSLRLFEADWLYTQLPNSTTNVQNNLRVGAGIVFRLP